MIFTQLIITPPELKLEIRWSNDDFDVEFSTMVLGTKIVPCLLVDYAC